MLERARLERARQRIERRRETLREELARLAGELDALADRARLLAELVDDPSDSSAASDTSSSNGHRRPTLKGAAIRERAARRFFVTHGSGKAMHYRRWFELLLEEGVEVGGKDPMATFLTNLNRSPVVVRGSEPGTYAIDLDAPSRLHKDLSERQAELRDLSEVIARQVTPAEELRAHRTALNSDIRRLQGLISEAARVLLATSTEREIGVDARRAA